MNDVVVIVMQLACQAGVKKGWCLLGIRKGVNFQLISRLIFFDWLWCLVSVSSCLKKKGAAVPRCKGG